MYAEVLIEYSAKSIDKTFTYIIPANLKNDIKVGMKVQIPFGTKTINGFVTNIIDTFDNSYELKEIVSIVDKYLCLNKEMMELGSYLQEKTLCTKIAAYQTMLPSSLKVKEQKTNYSKYLTYITLTAPKEEITKYIEENPRKKINAEILTELTNTDKILKNTYNSSNVKQLIEAGLIKEIQEQIYRLNKNKKEQENIALSKEQQKAINSIDLNTKKTYLLHGVTGSGKTEVYMQLIEETLKQNKTAIMLVPEISLTTQIVNRFYDRFGSEVAIFHSALSDGEKFDEYLKISMI